VGSVLFISGSAATTSSPNSAGAAFRLCGWPTIMVKGAMFLRHIIVRILILTSRNVALKILEAGSASDQQRLGGNSRSHIELPWLHLTVRYVYTSNCTTLLQKTTNLVHCRLDLSSPGSDQANIVIPSLESLTFDRTGHTPGHLNSFIVPSLRNLDIPERSLVPNPIGSLQSFISKSGCRLQEVHLTDEKAVSEDSYRVAFPSIPNFSFAERL
jgi:hypothetical protein